MTLISCPECKNEISSQAEACPKCGYSLQKKSEKKSSMGCGTGCLIVIILFVIYIVFAKIVYFSDSGSSSSSSSSSSNVDLNARVNFTGTEFVIVNNDSFDWTNIKLEVNSKTLSSGYTFEAYSMNAGQTYTIGATRFAKSDGEKFNPFTHKALNLSIWCDTPRGKGFYYGTWK